ncbi:glycoside hydrolase family 127 protein [Desertihabitans brevis]|uniref:Glycoside hydrolase family 127 protein n=1 Tax=Desertihabitans brevis TaxID=2268447 RepID=A0A367YV10_9ACTN|nr:beta-L-arabinofuranosidase domain-containing protein [Desertihabitans brevis]RCK68801.1 glycoside hydrolase family 127 protein [Desertihabitans brevis]
MQFSDTSTTPAPVVAAAGPRGRVLGAPAVRIRGGLLGRWQQRNRSATVPHTVEQLRRAGNLENFTRLPDGDEAGYRGRYPFLDTDVYKTLEGLAHVLADDPDAGADVRQFWEEAVAAIDGAQQPDGYLNTWYSAPDVPAEPWSDLGWGHELYSLGHLVQAAVAARRRLGDDRLLAVATRFADLVVRRYGPDGEPLYCGHPEVEMALVELYRETGDERYLTQASLFVERRGSGRISHRIFPPDYFQDAVALRELDSVVGHAVRMVYLAAGATDVALETGDRALLERMELLWDDMVASKLYLTGGLGSRHSDEAVGDRFELPSERAYNETCAAIGTLQWGWRLFVATGRADVLDVCERVLHNAFAVGLSAEGTAFFYDNPLQRRPDHTQRSGAEADGGLLRLPWFGCPCCPPNVVRWMAQLADHLAVADDTSLTLAQLAEAEISSPALDVRVATGHPFAGTVSVTVTRAAEHPAALVLRVPSWADTVALRVDGQPVPAEAVDGWLRLERRWMPGQRVDLELGMPVRLVRADPRVDAVRGSLAVLRGPLVHCVEQTDLDVDVEDLVLDPAAARDAEPAAAPEDVLVDPAAAAVRLPVGVRERGTAPLYRPVDLPPDPVRPHPPVPFVPYFAWGNREPGAMRVWLPET